MRRHNLAQVKIIWLGALPCITPLSHEQETLLTILTVGILASIVEAVHMLCKPLPLLVGNIGRGPGGLEVITYQEFDLRRVWHWQRWGGGMRRG